MNWEANDAYIAVGTRSAAFCGSGALDVSHRLSGFTSSKWLPGYRRSMFWAVRCGGPFTLIPYPSRRRRSAIPYPSRRRRSAYRRARRPPRWRIGASGNGCRSGSSFGTDAGSSFASADLSGARRGDSGTCPSEIERRTAAVTGACSSSVKSMAGIRPVWGKRGLLQRGGHGRRFILPPTPLM
jgi:hypothetical protein